MQTIVNNVSICICHVSSVGGCVRIVISVSNKKITNNNSTRSRSYPQRGTLKSFQPGFYALAFKPLLSVVFSNISYNFHVCIN